MFGAADSVLLRMVRNGVIGGLLLFVVGAGIRAATEAQSTPGPRAQVTNVRSEPAGGGVINLTYDLESSDPNAVFAVVLEVSQDGGQTFTIKPVSVTGDIGPSVRAGRGRKIVWEAGKDVETVQLDQLRFNIRAAAGRPVGSARLTITSTPPGATVRVDGTERGQTPLTLTDLTAAQHEIVVAREGYLDNRRTVDVRAGQDNTVNVTLTAAAPSSGQPAGAAAKSGGGVNPLVWVGVAGGGAAAAALAAGGGGNNSSVVTSTPTTTIPPTTTSAPATCQLAASGSIPSFTAGGGTATVTVTATPSGCSGGSWTTSTGGAGWLTINPSSGTGNATVTITVQPNTASGSRTATITIANQNFTVSQSGASACTFDAYFADEGRGIRRTIGGFGSGGSRTIPVTAQPTSCEWRVFNLPTWLRIRQGNGPFTGNRDINVEFAESNAGPRREANFNIGTSESSVVMTVIQCAVGQSSCS